MKKVIGILAACLYTVQAFAATAFCISVNDPCCTGGSSFGTHQLTSTDDFRWWYIHYDTGNANNKVTIIAKLDGSEVWRRENLCGCGSTTVDYHTSNQHLIRIEVECTECGMQTCVNGTASVQVYTPSNSGCPDNCQGD
ncbi:MAG: hypothetical protein IPP40_12735 [bacterium]|nr:hypothetical protein [bacterium]